MKREYDFSKKNNITVNRIVNSMSIDEKIGQLLFLKQEDEDGFSFTPGGIMFRSMPEMKLKEKITDNILKFKIPPFVSANLEAGPKGMISDSIEGVNPLQIAAANKVSYAYELGKISGAFAKTTGANMAFSPIVDINININNPMTATRGFGGNVDKVIEYGINEFNGFNSSKLIPVIKHFPGDGVSDTDQHLLTAVNSLDFDTWKLTYGKIYKKLIESGAEVVMVGHISLPKFVSKFDASESNYPASVSKIIINKLLKEELGYKGLVITDSTHMAGYTSLHSRKKAIILSLNSGIDMILFSRDADEDFKYIKDAYNSGEIREGLIDEKVRKIISLKLKHNILNESLDSQLIDEKLKIEASNTFSEITCNSITLLKDKQELLPICFNNKKILILPITRTKDKEDTEVKYFKGLLEKEGASITVKDYRENTHSEQDDLKLSVEEFRRRYDLVIYLVNVKILSNRTSIKMEYNAFNGVDAPWFTNEVDTILISLSSPFHDRDAPMIKTIVNGYNDTKLTMDHIVKKLKGDSSFKGIDPFTEVRKGE